MCRVSVIVPAYNAEKTIINCLKSLVNQTYLVYEIIVVDDGSKDKTRLKVEEFQKEFGYVKYFYQTNSGVSEARNKGVQVAGGDVIAFCDSDDYVENNYIELMVDSRNSYSSDLVICGYKKKIGQENFIFNSPYHNLQETENIEAFVAEWYKNSYIAGVWGALYDLKIIKTYGIVFPKGIHHGEDTIFNIRYIQYCEKVSFVNEASYNYIDQKNSLTSIFREDIWENQKDILENYASMCETRGFSKKAVLLFAVRNITLSLNMAASHHCTLKKWRTFCYKMGQDENVQELFTVKLPIDSFGKIVVLFLKRKCYVGLFIVFRLKIFVYEHMKKLYFTVRR